MNSSKKNSDMKATYYFDMVMGAFVICRARDSTQALKKLDRASFLDYILGELQGFTEFLGLYEGTVLSDEAFQLGLETESFTVDSGLAPKERDWVSHLEQVHPRFYFASESCAELARKKILNLAEVDISPIEKQQDEDWNANWKKAFQGIELKTMAVLPPHYKGTEREKTLRQMGKQVLWVNPGAGFGTGTHETTQLCLETLSEFLQEKRYFNSEKQPFQAIDFGSGSGILAVFLGLCGAEKVYAVEIDELAIENSKYNSELNGISPKIFHKMNLPAEGEFHVVVANILRPVLVEFAHKLVERMADRSLLVLSGLVESDVLEIKTVFEKELRAKFKKEENFELKFKNTFRSEWHSLSWQVQK